MLGVPYYYFYTLVVFSERKGNLKRDQAKKSQQWIQDDPDFNSHVSLLLLLSVSRRMLSAKGVGSFPTFKERWMWLQPTPFNNRATKQSQSQDYKRTHSPFFFNLNQSKAVTGRSPISIWSIRFIFVCNYYYYKSPAIDVITCTTFNQSAGRG